MEEYARIRDEIAESQREIETLRESIHAYGEDTRAAFDQRYQEFQRALAEKTEESIAKAEVSFRDRTAELQDAHSQFVKEQGDVIADIATESARLRHELKEVKASQHTIGEHSKVITKALALQKRLSANVETLHQDVEKIEARKEDIAKIEKEFAHIHDLAHKMRYTFDRISGERRKIDSLEKNWMRLNSLSDEVTRNIDKVHAKYDQVKELQVRMRDLDSIGRNIDEHNIRLEKQQQIVQATLEGVNKNFNDLSEIEERVQHVQESIKGLPEEVIELREHIKVIRENSLEAEEAREQSKKLDKALTKLEKRMNEVKGSQQWLGSLETRLQKIYSEADEKLTMMHALIQDHAPQDKSHLNGDSTRNTIKQLARKGWSPEQISNALKISIGEIEVVLGMSATPR